MNEHLFYDGILDVIFQLKKLKEKNELNEKSIDLLIEVNLKRLDRDDKDAYPHIHIANEKILNTCCPHCKIYSYCKDRIKCTASCNRSEPCVEKMECFIPKDQPSETIHARCRFCIRPWSVRLRFTDHKSPDLIFLVCDEHIRTAYLENTRINEKCKRNRVIQFTEIPDEIIYINHDAETKILEDVLMKGDNERLQLSKTKEPGHMSIYSLLFLDPNYEFDLLASYLTFDELERRINDLTTKGNFSKKDLYVYEAVIEDKTEIFPGTKIK